MNYFCIRFAFCTMMLLVGTIVYAQNIEFKRSNFPDKVGAYKNAVYALKEGDSFFEQGPSYYLYALKEYKKAQKFNPNNAELNYKVGVCYLNTLNKTVSKDYLLRAVELDSNVHENINLELARSYHINKAWDTAISYYETHKRYLENLELSKPGKYSDLLEAMDKHIQECNYGKEYEAKPLNVTIHNIGTGVNTQFPEYLVIINADETVMMFTSMRPGSTGEHGEEAHDEFHFHHEDIYVSKSKNGEWQKAKSIGKPVNTHLNDATIALAPDGHTVLTYNDNVSGGDIYECKLNGDKWSEPKRLSENINSPYHEASACFSYDGRSLYFVSDNPKDNYGDHDIFVSHWNDSINDWGVPENLGPKINTKYSEQGIYAHPDGHSIYFSSKGHTTMGGFDIFKSEWDEENEEWGEPVNVGYPINSPDNDVGLVMSASGKHAYVSAYHDDSYGREDIYRIDFPAGVIEHLTLLKGHIFDNKTKKPLEANIEIIDIENHQPIAHFESNSFSGHYLISLPAGKNYAIEIEKDGYLFHSENFDLPKTDSYHEVEMDIYLDPIEVGSKIVLNNIFFDYDKATLRPESIDELEILRKFMVDNPTLRVELSGHTDSRGSDDYNQHLSEDRAHAVVDYLVDKGIEKSRMEYKGYGETQPMAPNDTEENMQLNRRTELKIIGK